MASDPFDFHLSVAPQFVESYLTIVLLMIGGYMIHITPSRMTRRVRSVFEASPAFVQAVILALVILVVIGCVRAILFRLYIFSIDPYVYVAFSLALCFHAFSFCIRKCFRAVAGNTCNSGRVSPAMSTPALSGRAVKSAFSETR